MSGDLPRILFFNINGSGLGHLSRCLAYARRLRGRARSVFFSTASAIEIIEGMGFEADYFVSEFWSRSHINAWNGELAMRFGLLLEELRPHAVVFDGTWPFHGFMDACDVCRVPVRAWSNRGLHKADFAPVPVPETAFDVVLRPGEVGTEFAIEQERTPGRRIVTSPVTLLRTEELLGRDEAREALGLSVDGCYVLLSLGPGNLKDVGTLARGLIPAFRAEGFEVAWARAPITVTDVVLPSNVLPITEFPLVRYMRAFDAFAGAAGYNTCCEVIQAGVPTLLVPNTLVADDQVRRACLVSQYAPVVVSGCETPAERNDAISRLLELAATATQVADVDLGGAEVAAHEILSLVEAKGAP
jgi:UDP:flavonoid glycosyltransferase YjiC (YdhE family)